MQLEDIFNLIIARGASDAFLKIGRKCILRVGGHLEEEEGTSPFQKGDFEAYCHTLLNEHQAKHFFEVRPDLDVAYSTSQGQRFRINLFRQQGQVGMVIRHLWAENLTFEVLNLPLHLKELAEASRGLVIVCGAAGSGKSTTLAAMVEHINRNFKKHIVTIEDPVEFLHQDKKSLIEQREVGFDTKSFGDGLRHVVRQSPDVIMIGEMRDEETMHIAISAAMTGHLVLTSMHTTDTSQTLDRMINYFPEHQRHQICLELSLCLKGVVGMRLVPTLKEGIRLPAVEIMTVTPTIRKLLFQGDTHQIPEVIKSGKEWGMQTFNQSLVDLYNRGRISFEDALSFSTNQEEFRLQAQGFYTGADSIHSQGFFEGGE